MVLELLFPGISGKVYLGRFEEVTWEECSTVVSLLVPIIRIVLGQQDPTLPVWRALVHPKS